MHRIAPHIQWMGEKLPVGHVFWPVFLVTVPLSYYILGQAYAVYGSAPAIAHPVSFMTSLLVILVLPSFMMTGYYLLWHKGRSRKKMPSAVAADLKTPDEAPEHVPQSGKFATFSLIAGLGFVPLLLFVGLLMFLDAVGVDVQDDNTRHMLVGGLVAAALVAERWSKIGVNFMLGGLLLWGGIYVYWHMADDTLSQWLIFDSGVFY